MNIPSKQLRSKVGKDKKTHFKVNEQSELMKFLLAQMPGKGRNSIKALLAHRQITVNDEIITQFNYPLEKGQQVAVNWFKQATNKDPQGLKIMFEDPYIIVIEKPEGLLSIATATEKEKTAYSILTEYVKRTDTKKRLFVVHRLDRETSGVMMFAKSEEVKQLLQKAWKDVVLERSYAVVVEGLIAKEEGSIVSWLKESNTLVMYSSTSPNDGQRAVTHYRVLQKNKKYSLLAVKLETGRKNQIRVHMHDLGHSIIGDKKYGATTNPIKRLGLHAQVLAFQHPVTGEQVRLKTPIPKEFLSLFS